MRHSLDGRLLKSEFGFSPEENAKMLLNLNAVKPAGYKFLQRQKIFQFDRQHWPNMKTNAKVTVAWHMTHYK